ncbi:endoplasmic reticulum-based factor for assembly of V-ATPase-domain-containing protein [Phaeosphaeriaceae sp. PMI808]|nr:endoplasmic reticulum-based factor for assembly of V-ATPase-domain-containing protein [Phaeosphaeriaceae sp. PMI808]
MVLLQITPGIARALAEAESLSPTSLAQLQRPDEPLLIGAKTNDPISHAQLIALSTLLKMTTTTTTKATTTTLAALVSFLCPHASPTPTRDSFHQRFPASSLDFSLGANAPLDADDDVTFEEVHRQMILIINILISIVCVALFIWVAARHWTVGKRLGLSLAGSLAIAIAEVAVYHGYVRKVKEAKRTERSKPEIKEIVKTWVIQDKDEHGLRFRKGKHR